MQCLFGVAASPQLEMEYAKVLLCMIERVRCIEQCSTVIIYGGLDFYLQKWFVFLLARQVAYKLYICAG